MANVYILNEIYNSMQIVEKVTCLFAMDMFLTP